MLSVCLNDHVAEIPLMLCRVSSFVLYGGDNKKQSRGERKRTAQLCRKSNKSSVSSLDGDFRSCLEGYRTDLCVFVCVFQDVSTVAAQCVWSLTFLAGLCVIVPPVF